MTEKHGAWSILDLMSLTTSCACLRDVIVLVSVNKGNYIAVVISSFI